MYCKEYLETKTSEKLLCLTKVQYSIFVVVKQLRKHICFNISLPSAIYIHNTMQSTIQREIFSQPSTVLLKWSFKEPEKGFAGRQTHPRLSPGRPRDDIRMLFFVQFLWGCQINNLMKFWCLVRLHRVVEEEEYDMIMTTQMVTCIICLLMKTELNLVQVIENENIDENVELTSSTLTKSSTFSPCFSFFRDT